jgi:hypothetical protein
MLSLLLITALAVQYPSASKPATDSTAPRRTTVAPRAMQAGPAVGRMAFHDRMRELWADHVVYTRNFIISAAAGLGDTADVSQRLLRNQDEIGDAIKPYYGDAAGSQLAALLRTHIQLAGQTLIAAKGTSTAMQMDATAGYQSGAYRTRMSDTVTLRTDTTKIRVNSQYPTSTGRMSDTAKVKQSEGNTQGNVYAQGQIQTQMPAQTMQVDSAALNQAVAALKANGDSIAAFLSSANPRGFAREPLRGAFQMHITLLLQEATAQLKKDYSGSISAFDESQRQALQMADMLSEGIMKQFPSRFSNKATTVSSR